jgi:hypothetical protein
MVCTTWSDQAVLVDGSNLLPQLSQLAQALRGGVLMLNTLESVQALQRSTTVPDNEAMAAGAI